MSLPIPELPSVWKIPKNEWQKRIESLLWRAGMMLAALVIDFLIANLGDLNIPIWAVGVAGLALGEWSKQIHNNLNQIKEFAAMGMAGRPMAGGANKPTGKNPNDFPESK